MKLQQIKLSGFKSFVDSTAIDIHGQLVGVVGPNGCGKSNVIDAVRWVLGESSAKQLRGESMLDVIFNGSIKRKPISRATVELIFDNSQKSLHGLWNTYDEISIKRLISRQGESIYYINNQQVRRKDITDLFLGTGVGSKGYAVIEQGMIGKIIESKPEDMRQFIEEAAGVSKYRERRKETLQRLNDTADNLQRLEDIHSEIINQLNSLQEQAKVAKLHQSLTHELEQTQQLVLAIKVSTANQNLIEANQFIQHCEEELRVLGYQLEEVNQQLEVEQTRKAAQEEDLQQLVEQFNDLRTNLARVEERYKHYSELLKRFESESVNLATTEQEINFDIEELTEKLSLLVEQFDDNQAELTDLTITREDQQGIVDELQDKYNQIAEVVANRQSVANNLKHDLDILNNSLEHKRQQKTNLTNRQAKLIQESQTLDFDQNYHFIKEEIELVNEDLLVGEISVRAKYTELETVAGEINLLRADNAQMQKLIAGNEAKTLTLNELLFRNAKGDQDSYFADYSELWQGIQVATGYECAVEAALGYLLTAKIIDKDLPTDFMPNNRYVLWLSNDDKPIEVKATSLAIKVTIQNTKLRSLVNYLNKVKIITHNEIDLLAQDEIGVSLDGQLMTRDYIVYNPNHGQINLLQLQNELNALEISLHEQHKTSDEIEQKLNQRVQQEQNLRNDIASLEAKYKRQIAKRHELQLEFTKQEQIFLQNQRHQERITQELNILSSEIQYLANDVDELDIQLEDKQIDYEDKLNASQGIELEKINAETSYQLAKNRLQELDNRSNKLIVDNQLVKQQQQHSHNLIEDKRLQLQAAKQKLAELTNEREAFNNNDQAQEILVLQEDIANVTNNMQSVQHGIGELSNKIIGLKNKAATLNSGYQRNLEKINQAKFKQQEQNILLATYTEQNGDIESDTLAEMVANNQISLDDLSIKIKNLDGQILSLGLVNLKAIEDLAIATEKESELIGQVTDLSLAKATLEDAIVHIDNETRKLLQTTFNALNDAIVVYFKTLFGGGNARLALTDKDILHAGVQIYAEPPGKKNSTIHLLSGGEKALAAMSFIFALFSLNPAPFCLLDEVDAPLDDANTQRFCNLVQELSSRTQFVYISHNRLAMEMADQLIGVTMQEKGVSTIVSVSLVEAIKHAENAE